VSYCPAIIRVFGYFWIGLINHLKIQPKNIFTLIKTVYYKSLCGVADRTFWPFVGQLCLGLTRFIVWRSIMRGAMENVTRMALQEMIVAHANESRFGYVLSEEGMRELIDTLYEFFETSRNLKAAGDRFIQQGLEAPGARANQGRFGR
jgi:hypothetical protein